jgi:hypothetical protein
MRQNMQMLKWKWMPFRFIWKKDIVVCWWCQIECNWGHFICILENDSDSGPSQKLQQNSSYLRIGNFLTLLGYLEKN